MGNVVIYSQFESSRLHYVLHWVFAERLGISYTLRLTPPTISAAETPNELSIGYGIPIADGISISAASLLQESGITIQQISIGTQKWQQLPVLFEVLEGNHTIPFDIFSAVFYLLSRYEEYLPFTPDKHGRYPATDSIAGRNNLLRIPIVDQWIDCFAALLVAKGLQLARPKFTFRPTYDIDIAYSHSYKGIKRIAGAYLRALLKGDVAQINERTQVLKRKKKDPYDSFAWLRGLHEQYQLQPAYFILCALRTTPFDKNIHPNHPAMVRVIRQMQKDGAIGIHPSYYALTPTAAAMEQKVLAEIIGEPIHFSRQHYIRMQFPTTCRTLVQCGITDDYSMGYATRVGFRAGTGASFLWYDLETETTTNLRLHPFYFMDTTAHYDEGMSVIQAFEVLQEMTAMLVATKSTAHTIFHNFSLGTAHEWIGWADAYQNYLAAMVVILNKKAVA